MAGRKSRGEGFRPLPVRMPCDKRFQNGVSSSVSGPNGSAFLVSTATPVTFSAPSCH